MSDGLCIHIARAGIYRTLQYPVISPQSYLAGDFTCPKVNLEKGMCAEKNWQTRGDIKET